MEVLFLLVLISLIWIIVLNNQFKDLNKRVTSLEELAKKKFVEPSPQLKESEVESDISKTSSEVALNTSAQKSSLLNQVKNKNEEDKKTNQSETSIEHNEYNFIVNKDITNKEIEISTITNWLKENTLMKIGALLTLLGIAWFVQYAFAQGWIGIVGRITLGFLFGAIMMGFGFIDAYKIKERGLVLLGTGAAIILLVSNIAQRSYGLISAEVAFSLMFITIVFVTFAAMKLNSRNLAAYSVFLFFIIPSLIRTQSTSFYHLFGYFLIITLGTLWVVYIKKWHTILFEIFILIFFFSLETLTVYYGAIDLPKVFFMYIFALLFLIISLSVLSQFDEKEYKEKSLTYLALSLMNVIFILIWTTNGIQDNLQILLLMIWAALFLIGGFLVFLQTQKQIPFIIYGISAMLFIGIATALKLEEETLFLAFSLEAMLAVIGTTLITRKANSVIVTSFLFLIPTFLSIEAISSYKWSHSIFFTQAISLYVYIFILIITSSFIIKYIKEERDKIQKIVKMARGLVITYGLILIWLVPGAFFPKTTSTVISLLIYTILGLVLYFTSDFHYRKNRHELGILILSGVILHLLFIDIWSLKLTGRIVVFVLIGMALISTAFQQKSISSNKQISKF